MSEPVDLQQVLEVARTAARSAGACLRERLPLANAVEYKGAVDPVTAADLEAQRRVLEWIRTAFPTHAILAEETVEGEGAPLSEGPCRWIVDPLDGTVNFLHGLPHFCTSIGFELHGQLAVGVIYDPMKDELFETVVGQGCRLNGHLVRVSTHENLERALLVTGFPYDRRQTAGHYMPYVEAFLRAGQGLRRLGSAALDLAYIACGRLDGYWEFKLKPWDVAAGMLMVREAGGTVIDGAGDPAHLTSQLFIGGCAAVTERMGAIIRQVDGSRPADSLPENRGH